MAKYKIDYEFDFTPTRENAQELLLDLASLAGDWAKETATADHSQCIALADHEKAVAEVRNPLVARIQELNVLNGRLVAERDEARQQRDSLARQYNESHAEALRLQAEVGQLRKNGATAPPSTFLLDGRAASLRDRGLTGMPHVGELVKLVPRPETGGQWYGGVIKAIHGKGGSKGIEVLPKGHGRTITVTKAQIKRYAVNERADQEALAREMGVPVG